MRYITAFLLIFICGIGFSQAQETRTDSLSKDAKFKDVNKISLDSLNMQDTINDPTDKKAKKKKKKDKGEVKAQEPVIFKDSTRLALEAMPRIAVRRSAIIPGWGQLTNKRWWKVPVIYGGIAGLVYSYDVAVTGYKEFLEEAQYRAVNNDIPLNEKYEKVNTEKIIQAKDFYRRNRDLTILLSVGLYALNLIDAYVDAKMFRYNMDDDLSFRIQPLIEQPMGAFVNRAPVFGLKMAVTIH